MNEEKNWGLTNKSVRSIVKSFYKVSRDGTFFWDGKFFIVEGKWRNHRREQIQKVN